MHQNYTNPPPHLQDAVTEKSLELFDESAILPSNPLFPARDKLIVAILQKMLYTIRHMHKQQIIQFADRSLDSLKTLPALFHLLFFVVFVMFAVLSINFEVFRVIRIGDLFIIIFAFIIGVNWYGQRMQETGYQDGIRKATETVKQRKRK